MAAPRLAREAQNVADVGCGYMQGTLELIQHHAKVYAVDSDLQKHRIAQRIAICQTYPAFGGFKTWDEFKSLSLRLGGAYVVNVLHTLPSVDQRVELLEVVRQNLKREGFVLIDVPYYEHYYKERMIAENAYGDGYIFRQGPDKYTFYRFTTVAELDEWARDAGFRFDFRIVDNHHWVRIYRRRASSSAEATLGP